MPEKLVHHLVNLRSAPVYAIFCKIILNVAIARNHEKVMEPKLGKNQLASIQVESTTSYIYLSTADSLHFVHMHVDLDRWRENQKHEKCVQIYANAVRLADPPRNLLM